MMRRLMRFVFIVALWLIAKDVARAWPEHALYIGWVFGALAIGGVWADIWFTGEFDAA